ncbi:MAG: hypothetical protein ACJ0QO_03000, partial [Parvicellaceae bacterium]
IDLYNEFSFFEVEKSLSDEILTGLKDKEYDDNSFVVEIANQDGGGKRKRDRSRGSDRNRDRNRNRNNSRGGGGNRRRR